MPSDRFDEIRREWIARHAGVFTIQKRRAEILDRRIRDRHRKLAGARPDPYNDNVIKPLPARRVDTIEGYVEVMVVAASVLLAPIGWPAGILLYRRVIGFIPHRLRSYPLAALLWAGVGLGALTLCLYQHGNSLGSAFVTPWLIAQIPATFLAAGIYGILNGWLAVDGATDWWPVTPRPVLPDVDYPMGPDDMTGPGIFYQHDLDAGEQLTPIAPDLARSQARSPMPVITGLVLSALGVVWTIGTVTIGVRDALTESIIETIPTNSPTVEQW
ncbi:hypothetical protein [Mycobacterium sp. SP-6446]|uniref:hypothetical protein n=1 Tax=Mycobacterium sp. SP-6446 TaxID=1834162 RepID=UPI00158B818D|nr:hypothetical protein [Mycobacterium sp. SP-6446]